MVEWGFQKQVIIVGGTKNGEIRKVPKNHKLTVIVESAKKVSKREVEILGRVTSIFTTQTNPDRSIKVLTIGNC